MSTEKNLLPKGGFLSYHPGFFQSDEARLFHDRLFETIRWEKPSIKLWGKLIPVPRLTAWYGDPEASYVYSGIRNVPKPWTPELLKIKEKLESVTGEKFNSVLLNLYRDGKDHMSWHADAEDSLGKNPVIASVSFGEVRKFGVKHRREKDISPLSLELADGSLLLMKGEMQKHWHHRVHPTKKPKGSRINLTFRKVIF